MGLGLAYGRTVIPGVPSFLGESIVQPSYQYKCRRCDCRCIPNRRGYAAAAVLTQVRRHTQQRGRWTTRARALRRLTFL